MACGSHDARVYVSMATNAVGKPARAEITVEAAQAAPSQAAAGAAQLRVTNDDAIAFFIMPLL